MTRRLLCLAAAALLVRCGADEAEEEALSFLTIGDWGAPTPATGVLVANAAAVVADALDPPPAFVLALGDNFYEHGVQSAADPQWDSTWRDLWLAASPRLAGVPWLAVLGNHDYGHGAAGAAAQIDRTTAGDDDEWKMPGDVYTRTFRDGAVAVVCFDAPKLAFREYATTHNLYTDADVAATRDALEAALAAAAAAPATRWLLVVGHYPVISVGEHHDTPALGELVQPLLERYAVDAYFCGHTHTLQHLSQRGVHYVVSGGGSKPDGKIRPDAFAAPADGGGAPGARETHFAQARLGFTTHVVQGDRKRHAAAAAAASGPPTTPMDPWAHHHRRAQARDDDDDDAVGGWGAHDGLGVLLFRGRAC